jgi:SAM-dependent methyltransferase
MSGWDDPATAAYYEAFCRRRPRYARANHALVAHARIASGMRVLDVAAGTGRTAEAALPSLGESGEVMCFEPSAAMRAEGLRRVADDRVSWTATLPGPDLPFDRILCGAAIWQLHPLPETLETLAGLLCPGGALCFNIPALYLSEPDEPGGGEDPLLLSLPALLLALPDAAPVAPSRESPTHAPLNAEAITTWLNAAGLRPKRWSFRIRVTQAAYADWLKIPILTDQLFGGLAPDERAKRIDATLRTADRSSWKWESWRGWTAWRDP